jgi:subtilisin family serine protease
MKKHNRILAAVLFGSAWLSGCANRGFLALLEPDQIPKQFLSRQIIVAISEDYRDQWPSIDREIQLRYAIAKVGEFPLSSIQVNCLVYRIPERGYPDQLPEILPPDQVIQNLSKDARIQVVQRNQVFEVLQDGDSDPYANMEYGPQAIGAELAHRVSTGRGVPIAVIDTGSDKDHPDLKGRIIKTQNFVEGGEASFATDRHGTAVAGVIAARANNGIGIYGVAPDSRITAVKACGYSDPTSAKASCASWTLAKAIDFAINAGNRIINLSLSGPSDDLLKKLLQVAYQKGIVVVAAASENRPEPGFPASLDTVIATIASDTHGHAAKPAWFSQYQTTAAPGIDILTTAPGEKYDFLSGSSLAAAHVTGAIALLLQQQKSLGPDDVRRLLWQSGRTLAADGNKKQVVLVDACRALSSLVDGLVCQ